MGYKKNHSQSNFIGGARLLRPPPPGSATVNCNDWCRNFYSQIVISSSTYMNLAIYLLIPVQFAELTLKLIKCQKIKFLKFGPLGHYGQTSRSYILEDFFFYLQVCSVKLQRDLNWCKIIVTALIIKTYLCCCKIIAIYFHSSVYNDTITVFEQLKYSTLLCYFLNFILYRVARKKRNSQYSRFLGLIALSSSLCWIEHIIHDHQIWLRTS